MITSIVSALTGVAVRKEVAMTGEISLRGRVLRSVLKESCWRRCAAVSRPCSFPRRTSAICRRFRQREEGLEIVPVATVDEVLARALVKPLSPSNGRTIWSRPYRPSPPRVRSHPGPLNSLETTSEAPERSGLRLRLALLMWI